MKIVIPGGSGQVGTLLANAFHGDGHEVVVLSRLPRAAWWRVVRWDGRTLGEWRRELDGADAVINLAGRSVVCRYNRRTRREIIDSRVDSAHVVGEAIARSANPPKVLLQMSTAAIYAHRTDAPHDEKTGRLGGNEPDAPAAWRFNVDVARAWEKAIDLFAFAATRKVKLRTALVMAPGAGGAFDRLVGLVRLGLGGRQGDGRQMVSWIHHADFVRAIFWLIEHPQTSGPVIVAAPHALPNEDFMRAIREAWGTGIGLDAPKWALPIGGILARAETDLLLKSHYVVPNRLLDAGFAFQYPTWPQAARDLVAEWRAARAPRRDPHAHAAEAAEQTASW